MTELIRLSPTGIEYGDYAWNFASGCGNNIDGKCKSGGFKCWAYSITQRFEGHYPNGFKPTIYPEALLSPLYLKKSSRILCAFMGDLFGEGFNPEEKIEAMMPSQKASIKMSFKGWIFTTIKQCPQHTFLFLTKQPQNLIKWSPFPDNCWVGVTIIGGGFAIPNFITINAELGHFYEFEAKVKFISFEPLLYEPTPFALYRLTEAMLLKQVNWIIIGAQTKPYKPPKIEWVKEIVEACDKAGVPVFEKNNLESLLKRPLRQEMPKVRR